MQRPHTGFYFFMNQNNGAADASGASAALRAACVAGGRQSEAS